MSHEAALTQDTRQSPGPQLEGVKRKHQGAGSWIGTVWSTHAAEANEELVGGVGTIPGCKL